MKLASPVTISFTEQRVTGMPAVDLENGYIRIPVGISTADGLIVRRDIVLDRPKEVMVPVDEPVDIDVDGPGGEKIKMPTVRTVSKPKVVAQCQRLAIDPAAKSLEQVLRVEQFESLTAFENARRATKQDDEIAAQEATGVADGWLLPALRFE